MDAKQYYPYLHDFTFNMSTERGAMQEEFKTLHRTEQQNVLRNIYAILQAASEQKEKGYVDARNEVGCRMANEMIKMAERMNLDYLPYI